MKRITEVAGQPLEWVQPSGLKMHYELRAGDDIVATLRFRSAWQTKLEFQDESGAPLIQFKSSGLMHLSATVAIQPQAVRIPELCWMVLFGWYLTVMMHMDSAAAASGGAAG